MIVVSLPLGFYLNEQDSDRLNYLADQMSGFVALGVGLIVAYTLIDKFNERAEELKYSYVRALNFHHLNHELSLFLLGTVGTLHTNNPDEQDRLETGRRTSELSKIYKHDFSTERQANLDALILEVDERSAKMLAQSNLTHEQVSEYLPQFERHLEKISGSFIPRLVETRLDIGTHALLVEADNDLKLSHQTLVQLGEMAPKKAGDVKPLSPEGMDTINEVGGFMAAHSLIFTTKTLLNLFFYTSRQVESSRSLFQELREDSKNFLESHPDLAEEPF